MHKAILTRLFVICLMLCFLSQTVVYAQVDKEGENIASGIKTLHALVVLVDDSISTDYEKAKNVYNWLVNNIQYDVKAFRYNQPSLEDPNEVIKKKLAVCAGFANTFESALRYMGIPTYQIPGYTLGFEFYEGQPFTRSKHVWVAFRSEKGWHLADPTWGSGYMEHKPVLASKIFQSVGLAKPKIKLVYVKAPTDKYFDVHPDSLIKTHLPEDPVWQLKDFSLNINQFKEGKNDIFKIDSSCFIDFEDTLYQLKRKTPAFQKISSAQRAYQFNPFNVRAMANGYGISAFEKLEATQSLNNINPEKSLEHYQEAYFYTENAILYASQDKKSIKQEHKDALNNLKTWYKHQNKFVSKAIKSGQKSITKNKKNLSKQLKRGDGLEEKSKKIRSENYDLYYDDKIYDVFRPEVEPNNEMLIEINRIKDKIKKNNTLIDNLVKKADSSFLVNSNSEALLDNYLGDIFTGLDTLIAINRLKHEKLLALVPQARYNFDELDSIFLLMSNEIDTNRLILADHEKNGFKDNLDFLKNIYKEMSGLIKENKAHYIQIKRLSHLDQDEDYAYILENEFLVDENLKLIECYKSSIEAIGNRKSLIKAQNKKLKENVKAFKKYVKALENYYKTNEKSINIYYTGEKDWIDYNVKSFKSVRSEIKKQIKVLEKEVSSKEKSA